jgi:aspartyl-tRNA(Asn)/glutamyl-tRNA(Gln) amidotransferase subunit C
MIIDDKLISHLEELSKLSLSEKEKEILKKDLEEIIRMFDILKHVTLDSSGPNAEITKPSWREDVVQNHSDQSDALANAPDADGTYFKVPKIIDL